jgi:hypothetical protein
MQANACHQTLTTTQQADEWIRLPKPPARLFGLTRSTLNELILPCEANGNRPPVKSVVIKKRHAIRGIRLIKRESLLAYLEQNAEGGVQ